jgi:hypothetical protein
MFAFTGRVEPPDTADELAALLHEIARSLRNADVSSLPERARRDDHRRGFAEVGYIYAFVRITGRQPQHPAASSETGELQGDFYTFVVAIHRALRLKGRPASCVRRVVDHLRKCGLMPIKPIPPP